METVEAMVEVAAVDLAVVAVDGVGPAPDPRGGRGLPAGAVAAAVESVTGPVTARNLATADAPRTGPAPLPRGTVADPRRRRRRSITNFSPSFLPHHCIISIVPYDP